MKNLSIVYYSRDYGAIYSKPVKEETITAETVEDCFRKFYEMNHRLQYCNGCYYKFSDETIDSAYHDWLKNTNTLQIWIENGWNLD